MQGRGGGRGRGEGWRGDLAGWAGMRGGAADMHSSIKHESNHVRHAGPADRSCLATEAGGRGGHSNNDFSGTAHFPSLTTSPITESRPQSDKATRPPKPLEYARQQHPQALPSHTYPQTHPQHAWSHCPESQRPPACMVGWGEEERRGQRTLTVKEHRWSHRRRQERQGARCREPSDNRG